jgi:hypothetical protein
MQYFSFQSRFMDIFKSTTTINKQQISYFVIAILVTLIAIFCSQINFTADQHNNNNNNNEDLNIIVTQNETDSVLLFNKSNNGSIMETIKSKTNNELIVINSVLKKKDLLPSLTEKVSEKKKKLVTITKKEEEKDVKPVLTRKVIKNKDEIIFESNHEVQGILVSSSVTVYGTNILNDSVIKSELNFNIPRLAIKFKIMNNFTFENNNRSVSNTN